MKLIRKEDSKTSTLTKATTSAVQPPLRSYKTLGDGSPPFWKADVRHVWIHPGVHNAKGDFWELVIYAPDGTHTKGLFTRLTKFAPAHRRRRRAANERLSVLNRTQGQQET
jgi:hypothetical protein